MVNRTEQSFDVASRSGDKPLLIISHIESSEKTGQRYPGYFSILWIQQGEGLIETHLSQAKYSRNMVFCFSNYQKFFLAPGKATKAWKLLIHPAFFNLETNHQEAGRTDALFFHHAAHSPIALAKNHAGELLSLLTGIVEECSPGKTARTELVFSYLKILLIRLARYRESQSSGVNPAPGANKRLDRLNGLINENCASQHKPSFYASRLHITVSCLNFLCKRHFNKSTSDLISERLLCKAKWELLHTQDQVKSIANRLGFKDEYYFSRFFKKLTGLSPKHYRERERKILSC